MTLAVLVYDKGYGKLVVMEDMTTLTRDEVRLTVENSLLEQEKRITKEFRFELETQTNKLTAVVEKQNSMYATQIVELNKDVATLNSVVDNLKSRISGIKAQMLVVATACTTLGGFIGFFIAQLLRS